jgi:hypothetical protein
MKRQLSQLHSSFHFPSKFSVYIYLSYDLLTAPLKYYDSLINPANESLVGTRFPYFPKGGPVPPLPSHGRVLSSAKWGGMEAGEDMLYPVQVLDGLVHEECGPQLLHFLQSLPEQPPYRDDAGQSIRCPVGTSVVSPSFGTMKNFTGLIVHTCTTLKTF